MAKAKKNVLIKGFKTYSALRDVKQLADKITRMDNKEIVNFLLEAHRQHSLYRKQDPFKWTIIRLLLEGLQKEISTQLKELAAQDESNS